MNKYGGAVSAIAVMMLIGCSDKEGEQLKRALRERDDRAIELCKGYARSQANHPSTVDFSIVDTRIAEQPDGSVIAATTFTAKNGFGLELKYEVACRVNGSGIVESGIREARG
ncbi:hypothetical protein [Burkholderia cepacia]|uniref:hypothetical protein n=1 Tax=Burkholderia cepacia TaxID=292 RepID=UPI001CF54FAC|nr:hypothetical protein [Burkholderia cepacia]MCA8320037.1 hypothetical protein [Burkholderia cepacia]